MALQIVAFKWGDKYTMEHVKRLRSMLARNLTIPWEFVLITDKQAEDTGALVGDFDRGLFTRVLPLWGEMRDAKLCGVRLRAFGADMRERIGERFAWIDLDVVITGNVDHIFGRTEPFVALATPRGPLVYNGSLVMMDAGAFRGVLERWTPERYQDLGPHYAKMGMHAGGVSDEGWMTAQIPLDDRVAGTVGRADGIYYFRHDLARGARPLPPDARMVIMNGRANDPSNAEAQRLPWVQEHWR